MKPRDRRIRTERARQERRARFQKEKDRRHATIEALERKREAWERAREATKEGTSNDSLISTTSTPTAPVPPSPTALVPPSAFDSDLAFQPSQAEQEAHQDLETQDHQDFDESWAHDLASQIPYSDEGESEIDGDDPTQIEDHYPSESEAGDADIDDCEQELEDEGAFEFDAVQLEWPLSGLQKQRDIDIEVNVTPGAPFPSGLVNISQENVGDPFKTAALSMASNSDIDIIVQSVCFIVVALHFLAGLATSWCIFLLKAFAFLLDALGRPDIAGQIPCRLPTALSYSGVPAYHVTGLPVCPSCGDVFPVGISAPMDCPRCSIPLYKEPSHPAKRPLPNPTRKALVPRIRLPFLSISAQLEGVFSVPGIEDEVDWWRTLNRQKGVYQDISDGKIWGELLDAEGKQFFRSVNIDGKKCAPDGELRIGVALAMDWCVKCFALL